MIGLTMAIHALAFGGGQHVLHTYDTLAVEG